MMSDINLARDFLKQFLPPEIVSVIDFKTLRNTDMSFIDKKLSTTFSDAIFQVQLKNLVDGVFISFLLEHKSYKDLFTDFQMLHYMSSGYLQQLKSGKPLQIILPIVYYHGKDTWELKRIGDFFSAYPSQLTPYIPDYKLEYIDLVRMDDDHLLRLQNTMLSAALSVQKYSHRPDQLRHEIKRILETIGMHISGNFLYTILVYSLQLIEEDESFIFDITENLEIEMKQKVLSTYDRIAIRQRKEGLEQGILQGIEQGKIEVLLKANSNGYSVKEMSLFTGISEERVIEILKQYS